MSDDEETEAARDWLAENIPPLAELDHVVASLAEVMRDHTARRCGGYEEELSDAKRELYERNARIKALRPTTA